MKLVKSILLLIVVSSIFALNGVKADSLAFQNFQLNIWGNYTYTNQYTKTGTNVQSLYTVSIRDSVSGNFAPAAVQLMRLNDPLNSAWSNMYEKTYTTWSEVDWAAPSIYRLCMHTTYNNWATASYWGALGY